MALFAGIKTSFPRRAHGDSDRRRAGGLILLVAVVWLTMHFFRPLENSSQDITDSKPWPHPSEQQTTVVALSLKETPDRIRRFQDCSIQKLQATNFGFLDTVHPLAVSEFVTRRDRIAQALAKNQLDAFVAGPGHSLSYCVNLTRPGWEGRRPEEHPLLMIIRPQHSHDLVSDDDVIRANTTFLVPSFAADYIRPLDLPFLARPEIVTYNEEWELFATLLSSVHSPGVWNHKEGPLSVMVDNEMQDFISHGLGRNGIEVQPLGGAVEQVMQIKSEAEVEILRAVNTGTVESIRAMRGCMEPGLTEDDVMLVLNNTLRAAGMDPSFGIVLFDGNATDPYAGMHDAKRLEDETMVTIDVSASLFMYSSFVSRSFFPPFLQPLQSDGNVVNLSREGQAKMRAWNVVSNAQSAMIEALSSLGSYASAELAARGIIESAGYGGAFAQRYQHGIGMASPDSLYPGENSPHLRLETGMTVMAEPGVYLLDKFVIRHADVILITGNEATEVLSGQRANDPWTP